MLVASHGALGNGSYGRTTSALALMAVSSFIVLGQHPLARVAVRSPSCRMTNRQSVAAARARRFHDEINVFSYLASARIKYVTRENIRAIIVIDRQINPFRFRFSSRLPPRAGFVLG